MPPSMEKWNWGCRSSQPTTRAPKLLALEPAIIFAEPQWQRLIDAHSLCISYIISPPSQPSCSFDVINTYSNLHRTWWFMIHVLVVAPQWVLTSHSTYFFICNFSSWVKKHSSRNTSLSLFLDFQLLKSRNSQ